MSRRQGIKRGGQQPRRSERTARAGRMRRGDQWPQEERVHGEAAADRAWGQRPKDGGQRGNERRGKKGIAEERQADGVAHCPRVRPVAH
jgi:hypothetical protein